MVAAVGFVVIDAVFIRFMIRTNRVLWLQLFLLATCVSIYASFRIFWPDYSLFTAILAGLLWPVVVFEAARAHLWLLLASGALILLLFVWSLRFFRSGRAQALLILVFALALFEGPMAAQSTWSDWQIARQADALGLDRRVILSFDQSMRRYFKMQRSWFSDLHGRGCADGRLYLWSYRANDWTEADPETDRYHRDLNDICGG
ncbi:MAG: hypothetical protein P8X51_11310 [Maritimibacter sp.]